jgi:hypothetical protein
MGLADSPLRDRVLFVTGVPRSGTTWLSHMLGAHPEIAGVGRESHLFDLGVNALFDNFEREGEWEQFLSGYLDRPELVALVRDLCDGVLLRMREREGPSSSWVLEKTPIGGPEDPRIEIRRRTEVYPDAWYLHIIRDGRAVARSMAAMPWALDWTPAGCARAWRNTIEAFRDVLGGHPRYREVRYEELRAAPDASLDQILGWIGLPAPAPFLAQARSLSAVTYASPDERPSVRPERWKEELTEEDLRLVDVAAGGLLRDLGYAHGPLAAPPQPPAARVPLAGPETAHGGERVVSAPGDLIRNLISALIDRDRAMLRALCAEDVRVRIRTQAGDLEAAGEEGIEGLARLAESVFGTPFETSEWATTEPGPVACAFFSGTRPGGERVDLTFPLLVEDGRITTAAAMLVGEPAGRRVRRLEL